MTHEKKFTMKRSRRVFTTALVVIAAVMVDLDGSFAFSPASDVRSTNSADRRRNSRASNSGAREDEQSNHRTGVTGTDLNVAMTPSLLNIAPASNIGKIKKTVSVTRVREPVQFKVHAELVSLPASSRAVSLGKRNRNSRMVRPASLNSSPRLDTKAVTSDREGFLDKAQESKLTISIRSLRRAIRIRDALVEASDRIPSEAEWAKACKLSVLGLRRVMYEGQQARTVLVSMNVGLVTAIAKRHFAALKQATEAGGGVGTILTIQDLIQEGNLGLMQAAERFEADRGHRFSTYATYWIKQRILRSISDSSRIIRLPAHVHSMLQKINRARKEVADEIGRKPSAQEVAQYLEVSVDELEKYTSRSRNVISLESPLRKGGSLKEDSRTIGDLIASDAPTPEEDAQRAYLKDDIRAVINELADRERDVLILRFGLDNGEPMSVSQTAKHLHISIDRVRILEAKALNKLRSPQRNYRLKEYVGGHTEEEQVLEEIQTTPEKIWFF